MDESRNHNEAAVYLLKKETTLIHINMLRV